MSKKIIGGTIDEEMWKNMEFTNRWAQGISLRDDASIWTTSLNVGVNCAQKEMKVRFWENDDIVYHVKF